MYSDIFCQVYNVFGWNYYPEIFGQQLLLWLKDRGLFPSSALDVGCGTGILCQILKTAGMEVWGMDLSEGMIAIARQQPGVHYDVGNMVTYQPGRRFDLVTCTGDALNHLSQLQDVEQVIRNVHDWLEPGGWFVFDILDEQEISDSEPFEMDFSDSVRVWFQMKRTGQRQVSLTIRVFEEGRQLLEEVIRETVHDVQTICAMLTQAGFSVERCAHSLRPEAGEGTTWFVIARKNS